jgi:hypothetical protein
MDWEAWLQSSGNPPSDTEDSKAELTEKQIRTALASYRPLRGRDYVVYTKGSYANSTNVRLDYDVDIAVEYRGYFYSELCFDLEGQPKSTVGVVSSDDPYTRDEFKADIRGALEVAFGKTAVTPGRIAYRIRERQTTLPADVVPCWEYRRYDRVVNGRPVFHQGARIYPSTGSFINNFPQQQLDNGRGKNGPTRTNQRYKRMVRALKRLETRLLDSGALIKELGSYFIECLVYNVPDSAFGHSTHKADMREVLAAVFNATLPQGGAADWEEVNGLKYLFRGGNASKIGGAHALADAAWDEIRYE